MTAGGQPAPPACRNLHSGALPRLAQPRAGQDSGDLAQSPPPDRTGPQMPGGESGSIADELARWRAEALRLRETGLRMATAFDAMREAEQLRTDAEEHLRAAAASLGEALERTREAVSQQNQALREFMIPGDVLEN